MDIIKLGFYYDFNLDFLFEIINLRIDGQSLIIQVLTENESYYTRINNDEISQLCFNIITEKLALYLGEL